MKKTRSHAATIVTGGSRGIGYETARIFARRGDHIIICSRHQASVESAAKNLSEETSNPNIIGLACDVSKSSEVIDLFKHARQQLGGVDTLVNNAGYLAQKSITSITEAEWDETIDHNLKSAFLCTQQAMLMMIESGRGGHIVNISSLSGIRFVEKFGNMGAYIASKHAIVGLTEATAVEGQPHGIKVNCVAPGSVDTRMFRDNFPKYQAGGSAEEVARIITAFCDEKQLGWQSGNVFEIFCNAS